MDMILYGIVYPQNSVNQFKVAPMTYFYRLFYNSTIMIKTLLLTYLCIYCD